MYSMCALVITRKEQFFRTSVWSHCHAYLMRWAFLLQWWWPTRESCFQISPFVHTQLSVLYETGLTILWIKRWTLQVRSSWQSRRRSSRLSFLRSCYAPRAPKGVRHQCHLTHCSRRCPMFPEEQGIMMELAYRRLRNQIDRCSWIVLQAHVSLRHQDGDESAFHWRPTLPSIRFHLKLNL